MNADAEEIRDEGENSGPRGTMRLASSKIYPDLCDLQYMLNHEDGRADGPKRLSATLTGRLDPPPTRPEWYGFAAFCRNNKLETDGAGLKAGLVARYEGLAIDFHDAGSWRAMLARVDAVLRERRAQDKAYKPSILQLHPATAQRPPIETNTPPPGMRKVMELGEFQLDRRSWTAYEWEDPRPNSTRRDAQGEDDEWAACCEFMLHPYDRKAASDGKVFLGTTSVAARADMLGAYRFLSRVAAGQGGTAVQTIGQPGTLKTQLVITCILRLIVLSRQHYYENQERHRPAGGGEWASVACGAGDPFGIQCACRPGTITRRLASIIGRTKRPFVYLVKGESMDRCYEAMSRFFLPRLRSPVRCPMLSAVKCEDVQSLSEPRQRTEEWGIRHILCESAPASTSPDTVGLDKNQFIVLLDRARVAALLVPPRATAPDTDSWLWRQCRSLCTCVFGWQFPSPGDTDGRVAAKAVINWARRMRFATPGEMGLVSITTPGEVSHGNGLGHRRHLLNAIAPAEDGGIEGGGSGLTAPLLRRLGFIPPYTPDVTLRAEEGSGIGRPPPSARVTVEHMLLQTPPTTEILADTLPQVPSPGPGNAERSAHRLLDGNAPRALTHDLYATLGGLAAKGISMMELLRFTPATFSQVFPLAANPEPESAFPPTLEDVMDQSLPVQLLLRVIVDGTSTGGGSILVLANDEAMAHNITGYINRRELAGVFAAITLPSTWLPTAVTATTHLEAEVRMYTIPPDMDGKIVIVAGPDAMDSGWLSMHNVDYCVIFGAPFSPLPLRSLVQAVCGSGVPRDVRIVHIGLAGDSTLSLNGLMRVVCMDQRSPGLGIDG